METINHVLHFLNYSVFVADLRKHDYNKFNHVKKNLKDKFQDVDSEQLIHMLGDIDDLRLLFLRQEFNEINPVAESLLKKNFALYEKKSVEE